MKKRILAPLCACLLLLSSVLIYPAQAVNSRDRVYFMVVNETVLDLRSDTMPFTGSGTVYVPYIMFDPTVTGVNLGVFASNSNRTVMIYSRANGALMFDLAADTTTSSMGNSYSQTAITRNSMVFLPINVVCDYFKDSIDWSFLMDTDYDIVRVTNESAVYSDTDFVPGAKFIMDPRYNAYIRSLTPPASSDPPATRPSAPVQPEGGTVYLAFRCDGEAGSAAPLAAALKNSGTYGLFFFRPEELAARDDEVRTLAAAGHRIGLLLDGGGNEAAEEQLAEGNRLLGHILRAQTSLVLVENGAGETPEGQFVWTATVDGTEGNQYTATRQIRDILRAVSGEEESFVLLDDSQRSAEILERLVSDLTEEGYELRLTVETVLA